MYKESAIIRKGYVYRASSDKTTCQNGNGKVA